ncbi:MAG: hypothetical protein ACYTE5_10455 [Planctomycetota bacterium]
MLGSEGLRPTRSWERSDDYRPQDRSDIVTAEIVVCRPASCTAGGLDVNMRLSGVLKGFSGAGENMVSGEGHRCGRLTLRRFFGWC